MMMSTFATDQKPKSIEILICNLNDGMRYLKIPLFNLNGFEIRLLRNPPLEHNTHKSRRHRQKTESGSAGPQRYVSFFSHFPYPRFSLVPSDRYLCLCIASPRQMLRH
jgi:hypothetical protein